MAYLALGVQILGEFSLVYDGVAVTGVNSARLQSLLTYLILHTDTPQLRHHVAFLLWPNSSESQARNNLRQFLYQLRRLLPDSDRFLAVGTNTVYWKVDEGQDIDVRLFEYNLEEAEALEQRGDIKAVRKMLERTIVCYKGDLLPACYDDWISPERERLRQLYLNACQKLVSILESQREYVAAIQAAQSRLRFDPLNESAYVSLIRLHSLNEDYASARRVYQSAVEILQHELDVEPSEALQSVYDRLQHVVPHAMVPFDPSTDSNYNSIKLVGRIPEWEQLQSAWQHTIGVGGQFVLITGEAGIGKSRLAEELFYWTTHQGFTTAYTRSYGAEGRLALAPITEWLRSTALRPHLASLDPVWLTEIARLLPEILNEYAGLTRPEPISEYGRRQRFFEALARGVRSAPGPLLLWIDDLQWCDQETLEWLHFLLRFDQHYPLFILGTARSEESPPEHPLSLLVRQLQTEDRVTVIELTPLDAAETAKLAHQVQGYDLGDMANIHLFRETEGNPLFVVETVRASLDRIKTTDTLTLISLDQSILPPKVQATISGRLANLSPMARKVAEVGAAIGRAFAFDLLQYIAQDDEETIIQALDELWQKRIVREQSPNVFDFTHDKLREVAYAETSLPQRRLLHRRIAQALETIYVDNLAPISSQVATHYEQAGLFEQAIPYFQQAGSMAASMYANTDAIDLLTSGLSLLEQLPASSKRDAQELEMQLALATLYRINKGWASPEEERTMDRIMVLSDKVGNVEQRIRTLFGLQLLYVVQAQYEKVENTYAQAEKLFLETQGEPPPPFMGINLAGAKLSMGQLLESSAQFEKITSIRDSQHIQDVQKSQGTNYLVHGLAWNSHSLWCLGYPQKALAGAQDAIRIAREFAEPFNQAVAVTYLAMLQVWRTNVSGFRVDIEEACAIAEEHKASYYAAWAKILLCFARVEEQPNGENLTYLRDAIQDFIKTGARIRLPVYFSLLAQACLRAGRPDEGLDALELAMAESLQNNEHWWDAEIYRLRGELMWAQGTGSDDIEAAFQHAIEIARAQQARSLELRAATSLARLWQAGSRRADAWQFLTQVYDWFTEGFDTPDLQTARQLIAQL